MNVTVHKITDPALLRMACEATTGKPSNVSLLDMYHAEHSPIRTQEFWLAMKDLYYFVTVHFSRHKFGVEHFIKSNREDRGGDPNAGRMTPTDQSVMLNAQAIINMARKRLCRRASKETREVMFAILSGVRGVDPDLAEVMLPDCLYRGGVCHETRMCGKMPHVVHWKQFESKALEAWREQYGQ